MMISDLNEWFQMHNHFDDINRKILSIRHQRRKYLTKSEKTITNDISCHTDDIALSMENTEEEWVKEKIALSCDEKKNQQNLSHN